MSSKIFQTILDRKIENFVQSYIVDSKSLFYKDDVLFHPGEFGKYRESTLRELLKLLINTNYDINEGFIITSTDKISTQCDVIIYDKETLPFLKNEISKFYTIESILGIGEVKSDLSAINFKKALVKLAKNKELQNEIRGTERKTKYDFIENKHIVSFLVCRRLDFDYSQVNFKNIYGDIDPKYWHNCLLSIEDGFLAYKLVFNDFPEPMKTNFLNHGGKLDESVLWEYSTHQEKDCVYNCLPLFIKAVSKNKFLHIHSFLNCVVKSINSKSLFTSELLLYMNLPKANILKE
jgi:hypothetical protein